MKEKIPKTNRNKKKEVGFELQSARGSGHVDSQANDSVTFGKWKRHYQNIEGF